MKTLCSGDTVDRDTIVFCTFCVYLIVMPVVGLVACRFDVVAAHLRAGPQGR